MYCAISFFVAFQSIAIANASLVSAPFALVADFANNRVRRVDLHTAQVSTLAGSGSPGLGAALRSS